MRAISVSVGTALWVWIGRVRCFQREGGRYPSLPLIRADLRYLPFQAMSFDGLWAAASLMHLPKPAARRILTDLSRLIRPGGLFAATVTYGVKSRLVTDGWVPGRYFAR